MIENDGAEYTVRRVARNSAAQGGRFAALAVSKFLIVVVLARLKGVEAVGDFAFVMTFATALSVLNNLGMELLLVREIAAQRERIDTYLGNALALCLGLGIPSVVIMGGTARWLGYSEELVSAVYLAALALMFETLAAMCIAALDGCGRMDLGTLAIIIQEVALLIFGTIVLLLHMSIFWLFVVLIGSRMVGFIAIRQIYSRCVGRPPRLHFDLTVLRLLARKAPAFAGGRALSPITVRMDILLLSYFKGNMAVGLYEVASQLFYRLNVLARMVNLAMLPLIAREYPSKGGAVVGYVRHVVKYQAAIAFPITVVCWMLGDRIIATIFGHAFMPAVMAFHMLATVTFLRFVDNTLALTLTAMDLQGRRTLALAAMAAFNFGLNLAVLPRYGYNGAAATSVITEIGYFLLLFAFVRTRLPNPVPVKAVVRPIVAAAVMALPLLLWHSSPLVVLLPVGAITYGIAILALRVFTAEEMGLLLKAGKVDRLIPSCLSSYVR